MMTDKKLLQGEVIGPSHYENEKRFQSLPTPLNLGLLPARPQLQHTRIVCHRISLFTSKLARFLLINLVAFVQSYVSSILLVDLDNFPYILQVVQRLWSESGSAFSLRLILSICTVFSINFTTSACKARQDFTKFFVGALNFITHIFLVLAKLSFGTCMDSSLDGGAVFPVGSSLDAEGSSMLKLPQEAQHLLQTLALKLWSGMLLADVEDVCVRQLQGAFTNEVYECCWNTSEDGEQDVALATEDGGRSVDMASETEDKLQIMGNKQRRKKRRVVLVRVYGEGADIFFNRDDEIRTFEAVSRSGHGPRLLGRFPNGRVEEFLHARTLTAEDLREPDVSTRIAVKLREFHQLSMPGSREAQIWQRLRDWLQKALDFSSPKHIEEFQLEKLGAEIEDLRLRVSTLDSEIGFCHNDLQYGNIMMDEEDNTLTLIDYEYATYNPIAYDLANHFCEMAANYHTDTPHVLDFAKYPDLQERSRFIEVYLGSPEKAVSSSQVDQLSNEVDLYALASHIHWGLWGLISDYANDIDFNYVEYARQRFRQYWLSK